MHNKMITEICEQNQKCLKIQFVLPFSIVNSPALETIRVLMHYNRRLFLGRAYKFLKGDRRIISV